MHYLGVTGAQIAKINYEIVEARIPAAEKTTNIFLSIAMLGLMGFGISRLTAGGALTARKQYTEGEVPETKFDDVAGIDESRGELVDIVTFLKDGGQYQRLGARMPRGVLLVGDPGTGKTLLARAIAGEAGVPFFSTSGSEFVELFVGVGASRVRSLFKKARAKAPCIVFIDEIDAAGRKRHGSASSGGEMEQDQTLNQLLVEMDGFSTSEGRRRAGGNQPDGRSGPGVTRSGRFDRHVNVPRPDVKARLEILKVHIKDRPLAAGREPDGRCEVHARAGRRGPGEHRQRGRHPGGTPGITRRSRYRISRRPWKRRSPAASSRRAA